MVKGDFKLVKNMNEQIVLNLIREHNIISSSELVHKTGMMPSTIFNILKDLTSLGLILNLGKGESTEKGGKKPFIWKVNGAPYYSIGIDLEIGEIVAVVLDFAGERVWERRFKVEPVKTAEELIERLKETINSVISESKIEMEKILGVGIAVAGVVSNTNGTVITTDILGQVNLTIKPALEEHFPFQVLVENNANAAAIGAKWVGVGAKYQNSITVLTELGSNVGGMGIGLILHNRLYKGATSCAGELNTPLPKLGDILVSIKSLLHKGLFLSEYMNHMDDIAIHTIVCADKEGDYAALLFVNRGWDIFERFT